MTGRTDPSDVEPGAARRHGGPVGSPGTDDHPPLVDWARTARRLRAVLLGLAGLVVIVWAVTAITRDGLELGLLGELVGVALLVAFLLEVVIVGGSAIRGLLTAGERGERLASEDVSLLPPQLARRRRR